MPALRYLQYDVFTSRPFEGNQLAVFLDARGLTGAQMQTLANEMNFSESTFVLPAETPDTDVRMRISRRDSKCRWPAIPPSALPSRWSTPASSPPGVSGGCSASTSVRRRSRSTGRAGDCHRRGSIRAGPTCALPRRPVWRLVRAVGGDAAAWTATGLPMLEGSCGAPYFYLPLASRAAVDACQPDTAAMASLRSAFATHDLAVFVFSTEAVELGVAAYSRMFAPGAGVHEDPATGSATGPLGAYLVRHGLVPVSQAQHIVSVQGVKMGRPSRLHVRVDATSPDDITRVHVGGGAVRVGEGTISWYVACVHRTACASCHVFGARPHRHTWGAGSRRADSRGRGAGDQVQLQAVGGASVA